MGKLYRDRDEIAIPAKAYVNTYDGRVFVKQVDGAGKEHRVVIGKATSATTMAPNDTFRALYPGLWEAAYGRDEADRLVVGAGTYALALGAGLKSGIYRIVQATYGPEVGNALMDVAMYLLLARTDPTSRTTEPIEDHLADEVTFCPTVRSNRWFADTFVTLPETQHVFHFTSPFTTGGN